MSSIFIRMCPYGGSLGLCAHKCEVLCWCAVQDQQLKGCLGRVRPESWPDSDSRQAGCTADFVWLLFDKC